jgi:hypothetical protein
MMDYVQATIVFCMAGLLGLLIPRQAFAQG